MPVATSTACRSKGTVQPVWGKPISWGEQPSNARIQSMSPSSRAGGRPGRPASARAAGRPPAR